MKSATFILYYYDDRVDARGALQQQMKRREKNKEKTQEIVRQEIFT